jgi:hypothetical protein
MTHNTIPMLSKSRFAAGLQCLKRLYLQCYYREFAEPPDVGQQAAMDTGIAVGVLARQGFPDGRLIEEEYYRHDDAMTATAAAIADPAAPAVFEAGFTFDDVRTRVDVLRRRAKATFDLVEVKSSTSVKEEYIPDVAIQLYVLEGSGIAVGGAHLLHINKAYVYGGGPYDLTQLFLLEDVDDKARSFIESDVAAALARMKEGLRAENPPAVDIGRQCTNPYRCEFYRHCREGAPEHHVEELPSASRKLLEALSCAGITDIRDIPEGFSGLSPLQQRVRECVIAEEPYFGSGLSAALDAIPRPLYFLDFETFNPALPVYPGTQPYQVIPFQWSLHAQDSRGDLRHCAFLHDGVDDPRGTFLASLLDAVGTKGAIVTYSGYEGTIIKQLADAFPRYSERLLALNDRMLDLLALVKTHCYHPGFHGSYSIKAVLPALVPHLNYDDLEIQGGSHASVAFAQMIAPQTEESERERLRRALLEYCRRDTEAMVQIFDALRSCSS